MGWKPEGHAVELIIAKSEADAEYYAVHELDFVKVDSASLASGRVHVGPADTRE
jgi:hypothetical protein